MVFEEIYDEIGDREESLDREEVKSYEKIPKIMGYAGINEKITNGEVIKAGWMMKNGGKAFPRILGIVLEGNYVT